MVALMVPSLVEWKVDYVGNLVAVKKVWKMVSLRVVSTALSWEILQVD
jgi:hypothetical protein